MTADILLSGLLLLKYRTQLLHANRLVLWNDVQGVVEQCGISRDTGKENVDPTPSRHHPRVPRAQKVCTLVDVLRMCGGAGRPRLTGYCAPNTEFVCVCAFCCTLAPQLVVGPLQQSHAAFAAEDDDLAQCTQIPTEHARKGPKRVRKHEHLNASAEGEKTTSKPQRSSKSKKVLGLADQMLQTPMPASEAASDFGPPPPDTTPGPQRSNS